MERKKKKGTREDNGRLLNMWQLVLQAKATFHFYPQPKLDPVHSRYPSNTKQNTILFLKRNPTNAAVVTPRRRIVSIQNRRATSSSWRGCRFEMYARTFVCSYA